MKNHKNIFNVFLLSLCFLYINSRGQSSTFTVTSTVKKYSCTPGSIKLEIDGGAPPFHFNWSHGKQGEFVDELAPGNYNVSIVDDHGKDTLISIEVGEEKCGVRFNASFSPNGDNISDVWSGTNIQFFPDFTLQVFNRWGQLVHTQKKEFEPWDGKQLGIDLPVGTYYYIFYYKGSSGDYEAGSVVIMR